MNDCREEVKEQSLEVFVDVANTCCNSLTADA